jgi:hypothetical protein
LVTGAGHAGLRLSTPHGAVHAPRVALLRRLRLYLVPVYDYALITEPLSGPRLARLGWRHRQGVGDWPGRPARGPPRSLAAHAGRLGLGFDS